MNKVTVTVLFIIFGLLLLAIIGSLFVFSAPNHETTAAIQETAVTAQNSKGKADSTATSNNSYNYTHTYFTSNNRQHKFVTTYLELKNKKGEVVGVAGLVQMGKQVIIKVNASGLKPGKHGFHIHENPIINSDFDTAGGHYNPTSKQHGAHLGDMANLIANEEGKIEQAVILEGVSLEQGGINNSLLGKALIIHENGDDGKTNPSGNSGDRVVGGNIPQ